MEFGSEYPPLGQGVFLKTLAGSVFGGYWDGAVWWVGVNNDPNDIPLDDNYVESWAITR